MTLFHRNRLSWFNVRESVVTCCALLSLATVSGASAQTPKVRISVTSLAPAMIRIEAELPCATNVLSFRNTYAGVLGLGERIEKVEATTGSGESVQVRKLAPGEFQSGEQFSRLSYEVNVAEPSRPAQMSHVSWLNRDHGVLMLADLLPQSTANSGSFSAALVSVEVPKGWTVASNTKRVGSQFSTDDPETSVFLVGPALHEKRQRLASTSFSIITSGKWPFSDNDALKIAGKIIEEYSRVTRFELKNHAVLMLIPYPGDAGPESWSAETRGNDVVLVLGQKASRKKILARLAIVLSHELFHLWVPNSVKLAGDYDWFFEGFTLYQALRTDLRLGLISFDDYLKTIARVYDSYLSSSEGDRWSLIEASERRWTTSSSLVYEKGMLVAFIYDLSLRRLSKCRASLDDVYADLFRLVTTGQESANDTIIKLLTRRDGLESFAKDYIANPAKISLDEFLWSYGIRRETSQGSAAKFGVGADPAKSHRELLSCIGFRK
jgi:predicted metalloprotease with PDZ domain